ncbi:DivIVA domain-containing protein [Haloechinothrix salitolerans]|uniref:DivIVA domain-containing protein n=1 Tax=Haloechinothrix salitolerans TaxID=926830 RepID=A0ABW2BZX6_9PSEU
MTSPSSKRDSVRSQAGSQRPSQSGAQSRSQALPEAPSQREFAHHWNGYDRQQVREYLEQVDAAMRQLRAERDQALDQVNVVTKELEAEREETGKLRKRVDELMVPPENLDDLDQRMQRVGHLAYLQAEEVTTRAQTAAEENWKETAQASIALRERYRSLLKELDSQAEALHAEHRKALEQTRAEVQELTVDAVKRREKLDDEAERKRRSIEQEFEANMAQQKAELEKYIADQRTASKNQAEKRLAEASAEAQRRLAEATHEADRRLKEANAVVARLSALSQDAHGKLRKADEVLSDAADTLEPTEEERRPVPRAEDVDSDETASEADADGPDGQATASSDGKSPQPAGANQNGH